MLPRALADNITRQLLDWEYWIDEANVAGGWFQGGELMFTENHQMSFHASECAHPPRVHTRTHHTTLALHTHIAVAQ